MTRVKSESDRTNTVPDTRWTRRVSGNTVRPGMSVFSKNTGLYRVISAPRYSSSHTVKPFRMPGPEFEPRRQWLEANVVSIALSLLSMICFDFDRLFVCLFVSKLVPVVV